MRSRRTETSQIVIYTLCSMIIASTVFATNLGSPGFEAGPDVASIAFSTTDVDGLVWLASNTDGERIQGVPGRQAAEGNYYASMLQNAGAYDGSPLGIGYFGETGFDRIYAFFDVNPSTQYTVCFQHAGDDRYGYIGDTSVVEIVDVGTGATVSQHSFATPGLFDWQLASFTFESVAGMTQAAIAFTVMGSSNTSGMFDDVRFGSACSGQPIFADGFESGDTSGWSVSLH